MKKGAKILLLVGFIIFTSTSFATTYTWNGATTAWGLNTNWSPNGIPGSGDNVIIVTSAAQPLLNSTQSITDFTINSGTLDLNTFILTATGVSTFTSGTINNGTMTSTGTSVTFSGTVFGASVSATSQSVLLNGSTFNNTASFTKTGGTNVLSNGGNTFNGVTTVTNNGSAFFALANTAPDIFATNVTFNNTGTDKLYVAYNASGNQFNGTTTFVNASTALGIYSHAGIGATVAYNGNIIVNNASSTGGVFFGALGGTGTLATANTITVGGSGFSTGTLIIRNFTQIGATAQALTLTGTALLQTGPSAVFNGAVTFVSPQVLLNGTTFNNTASITKNGATQNNSDGSNVFVGTATLTNSGSGILQLGTLNFDTFNDLTINNSGTSTIQLAYSSSGNLFNGNISFQNAGTSITVGAFTGTSTLATGKLISASGFATGTLALYRFTQSGATAQALTLTGTAMLQMGPTVVFNGGVTFVSPQVLLNGCTFNSTATITKNGATTNTSIGGNIFNGVTILNCTGSGYLELGDTSPEKFSTDLTVNNTSTGRVQIGISSAGNLFNGNTIINHGGNTSGVNTIIARNAGSTATFNGNVTLNCANANSGSGVLVPNDGAVTFNGNVTVISTNGRGVLLAAGGGSATLASGFTITAGTFTTGTLTFSRFTQTGATPQTIALTGTADMTFSGPNTFNGAVTFSAPQLFLNGSTFNSTASLTKNGATDNASTGNNTFNGSTTITNSSANYLRLATTTADAFVADVTFVKSSTGALEPTYGTTSTFSGNVTVNSSSTIIFGAGTGTALFNLGNSQTINKTGSANPTFNRFQINKTANDVTLNTEVLIGTLATFTKRFIISSSANPVTFNNGATVASVSNTSFVSGPVKKTGTNIFTFPVGKSGFYRPIAMGAPGTATDQFTAEYFYTDPNPTYAVASKDVTINHVSRCEYWTLDRTTGGSNVTVTLSWDTNSCGVTNLSELTVGGWNGTTWKDLGNGGTTGTTATGTIVTLAAATTFGPFTLASTTANNPLPIGLLSLSARVNGNSVDVNWSTLTEKNNDYFVVQRTIDGEKFQSVDTVKGAGNSIATLNYHTKDNAPVNGLSYYRLRQVDFDKQYTDSKLLSINFIKTDNFSFILSPNPSSEKTNLTFSDLPTGTSEIRVNIYRLNGSLAFSEIFAVDDPTIKTISLEPAQKLSPGIYIVSVNVGPEIHWVRLVIN